MTEEQDAALAAGMDDYLPKPISQVALAAAIEMLAPADGSDASAGTAWSDGDKM